MLRKRRPFRVGLTGAIGAGKTTVAELLRKKGLPVIDADIIGREVLETSDDLKREIAAAFGPAVVASGGSIDRLALAEIAFASEEAGRRLNALVHPLLWERINAELASYKNEEIVVIDAALIVEWQDTLAVDFVVVVEAPEEMRRERCEAKYGGRGFAARQARQLEAEAKRARADIIIDNAGTEEALVKKVDELYERINEAAQGRSPSNDPVVI